MSIFLQHSELRSSKGAAFGCRPVDNFTYRWLVPIRPSQKNDINISRSTSLPSRPLKNMRLSSRPAHKTPPLSSRLAVKLAPTIPSRHHCCRHAFPSRQHKFHAFCPSNRSGGGNFGLLVVCDGRSSSSRRDLKWKFVPRYNDILYEILINELSLYSGYSRIHVDYVVLTLNLKYYLLRTRIPLFLVHILCDRTYMYLVYRSSIYSCLAVVLTVSSSSSSSNMSSLGAPGSVCVLHIRLVWRI